MWNIIPKIFKKEQTKMYDIFDIAYWFLNKESMPQKKLQKLCYYAQAWYQAIFERPLINGSFQAWVHGPVNRKLWNKTTIYGYSNITDPPFKGHELPINIIDFLEDVYYTYGKYDGDTLERQTHKEDPWRKTREGLNDYEPCEKEISLELMHDYYRKISLVDVNEYGTTQVC